MSLSGIDLEPQCWRDMAETARAKAETTSDAVTRDTMGNIAELYEAMAEQAARMAAGEFSLGFPPKLAGPRRHPV